MCETAAENTIFSKYATVQTRRERQTEGREQEVKAFENFQNMWENVRDDEK